MPELPEVETVRQQLVPKLVGRTIASVQTSKPSYFFLTPPSRLRKALPGETVEALDRYGKYLIARFASGSGLLLHLGMTGQLRAAEISQSPARLEDHVHLRLSFQDEREDVVFRDVRKFGKVRFLTAGQSDPRLDKLGPDALLTPIDALRDHLWSVSRRRRISVKALLLDQGVLAGVGNIYADEALFAASIRPGRSALRLRRAEVDRLCQELHRILVRSIKVGGSSIRDYVDADGKSGKAQLEHRVYGRSGQPCAVCESPIKRVVIATRSTHYCPVCQK